MDFKPSAAWPSRPGTGADVHAMQLTGGVRQIIVTTEDWSKSQVSKEVAADLIVRQNIGNIANFVGVQRQQYGLGSIPIVRRRLALPGLDIEYLNQHGLELVTYYVYPHTQGEEGVFVVIQFTWEDQFYQGVITGSNIWPPDLPSIRSLWPYQCTLSGTTTYLVNTLGPGQILLSGSLGPGPDDPTTDLVCAGNPGTSGFYSTPAPPFNAVTAELGLIEAAPVQIEVTPSASVKVLSKSDLSSTSYSGSYYNEAGVITSLDGPDTTYHGYTQTFIFRLPYGAAETLNFSIRGTKGPSIIPPGGVQTQVWYPVRWNAYVFPTEKHWIDAKSNDIPIASAWTPHGGISPELIWQAKGDQDMQGVGTINLELKTALKKWTGSKPPAGDTNLTVMVWGSSISGTDRDASQTFTVTAVEPFVLGQPKQVFDDFNNNFFPDLTPWQNLQYSPTQPAPLP